MERALCWVTLGTVRRIDGRPLPFLHMPGGMNKRGRWGPMTDRVDRTGPGATPAPPSGLKHCWVTDRYGRLPGLLLGWRQTDAGAWEGRVARVILADDGRWDLVEEWLPAGLLDPVS